MSRLFNYLILFQILYATDSLPTLGEFDRNHLETYEDLSERSSDMDIFNNLTFRFSCEDKRMGFYADFDFDCRIFHACDDSGNGFPMICPNDTFFDQRERICTENVDCENSHKWFYLNELAYSIEMTEGNELIPMEREEVPSVLPLVPP